MNKDYDITARIKEGAIISIKLCFDFFNSNSFNINVENSSPVTCIKKQTTSLKERKRTRNIWKNISTSMQLVYVCVDLIPNLRTRVIEE